MPANKAPSLAVIMTHEHTDFDALASLLGAARLYPQAIPVLPRKMNRNLEEFLAVYRDALPFVSPDDLPRRRIDHVILVDTQAVQPIRGMHSLTTGDIFDHHPLTRELPDNWSFSGDLLGATTTLLVEKLVDQGLALSLTEATLLLLGIYEDTGGLSYESTTARDLRAAAWLIERGGSLALVARFLHNPLTEEQRALYQQLIDNSQPYQFSGQSVIIATARLEQPVAEISTLAHKLRDLYEPDGLFLLVDMGDRLQLVARSTSDAIHVGKIATALGGGGHSRAAAAVIREGSLQGVHETLVYLLQSHVRPPITVSQIMSYGVPQTLSPDATIAEAAERVRRYGFEGFPVIEDGRILGMLTRREIDRAMHHGLAKHAVSRYMRAGEVYVRPGDSVEVLRQVMTEHDWGQVPVIDPSNQQLLGIVTRTDLIKQWTESMPVEIETLDGRMAAALPQPLLEWLKQAGEMAAELGFQLYAVGGFVRDLLLGVPNLDIDLVVEGDAIKLAHQLVERLGGRVRSHHRFGTAKWIVPDELRTASHGALPGSLDFVTARTEFYEHPTALPQVERSTIKQDLHRRDFTVNTLAIRLDPDRWGELLDFYGGKRDLEQGILRVLHSLSFVEDPTRILRAVRFEQRFSFRIEPRTEKLIGDATDLLGRVTGERLRHEVELILAEAEPERSLCRLAELNALAVIHPELLCDEWLREKARELRRQVALARDPNSEAPPHMSLSAASLPRLMLALLVFRLSDEARLEFLNRLRIVKESYDLVLEVASLARRANALGEEQVRPSEIVRALDESSDEARLLLRVINDSWLYRQRLDQYQRRLRNVRATLRGSDLRRMGIQPGPVYGAILERLRAGRLDGDLSTRREEQAMVEQIVASSATQTG